MGSLIAKNAQKLGMYLQPRMSTLRGHSVPPYGIVVCSAIVYSGVVCSGVVCSGSVVYEGVLGPILRLMLWWSMICIVCLNTCIVYIFLM